MLYSERKISKEQRVRLINKLRAKYPLKVLLKISGIVRATYYFYTNKKNKDLKNQKIKINHKKVLKLMNKL